MRTSLLTTVLFFILINSFCQNALPETQITRWGHGFVVLTDGTRLEGFIRYNHHEDHIAYDDGENSQMFTSRNFLQMNFLDESSGQQRVFISLPYGAPETAQPEYVIFEVLKEFDGFALLSRTEPEHLNVLTSTTQLIMSTPITKSAYAPEIPRQETIFIMDDRGVIHPYLKMACKKGTALSFTSKRSKGKILNEKLFAEYVSAPVYEKLQAYATDNHLLFSSKPDFMKVLAYYDTIKN
jgi:hypothetical protein